jgi:hypothetical protein
MKRTLPIHRLSTVPKKAFLSKHWRLLVWILVIAVATLGLLLYQLGTLTAGLSPLELMTNQAIYGWHGIARQPLYLPLNLVRSIVFVAASHHGALITRLPSVVFGAMSVTLFAALINFWHGSRTAILATILFACSGWLLHVSRLASNDILYIWAPLLLLVTQLLMHKYVKKPFVFYGSLACCGLLLYVPGMVWFVLLSLYWQRAAIRLGWAHHKLLWQRGLYVFVGIIWLPLLIYRLTTLTTLKTWLGLPQRFVLSQIGRQLAFVPVHLFIRGPVDQQRWLGHAPLLDLFALAMTLAGIWFYGTHLRATRSRLLASYTFVGLILVGLGGAVGLSILVPIMYIFAATGIAYLLHEWLRVFPVNPLARRIGIGLVVVAILASGAYNIRAYFVAWPHNEVTLSVFRERV